MAGGLPRYAVLRCKSNNKYVRCTTDGTIRVDGDDIMSPNCKLELERAQTAKHLFNIRSCYNNKYWQPDRRDLPYLKATAAKPYESPTPYCTTFRAARAGGHADYVIGPQSPYYPDNDENIYEWDHTLFIEVTPNPSKFTIIDWETLVILPKHVSFKGDLGTYLTAQWIEGHEYHKFDSATPGDPRVAYEIFPTGHGTVRIKSKYFNRFWRRSPNWIWADSSDDNNYHEDTLFMPVRVGKNTVALRNLGNNNYCIRLSKEWKENCLNADAGYMTNQGTLTVEELVSSRKVYNVRYRLNDAMIYHENIETMVTREATNNNSEPQTITLTLSYKETSSRTFEHGVSASLSVSTTVKAELPIIVDGEVQVSAGLEVSFNWGETQESSKELATSDTVTVPPYTRVKASVIATKGKCDVPFSYTVRDVLTDGRVVTYDLDDGHFIGINCYNFKYETTKYRI